MEEGFMQREGGEAAGGAGRPNRDAIRVVALPRFTIRHAVASGCEFEPHTHTDYTVTAVLAGSMSVTIGEESHDLSPGQVALTDAGRCHSGRAPAVEFVSINLSPSAINEMVAELGLTRANAEISFRAAVVTDDLITSIARAIAGEVAR